MKLLFLLLFPMAVFCQSYTIDRIDKRNDAMLWINQNQTGTVTITADSITINIGERIAFAIQKKEYLYDGKIYQCFDLQNRLVVFLQTADDLYCYFQNTHFLYAIRL